MLRPALLLIIAALVTGCASTSVYLGADPGVHVSPSGVNGSIPVDPELEGLVRIVPIDMHGRVRGSNFRGEPAGRSLYLSVDISGLIAQPGLGVARGSDFDERLATRRNQIVDVLLIVSDHNAETYLARAFANRAALTTSRNVARDVSLGVTSGLAAVGSPAASALGLAGLVLGAGVDEMNQALYLGETFHAMELVIRAERSAMRRRIRERMGLPYAEYSMADVLADVRRYSEACSVRFGLARLREAAQAAARDGL
jgi:hypothetical protein